VAAGRSALPNSCFTQQLNIIYYGEVVITRRGLRILHNWPLAPRLITLLYNRMSRVFLIILVLAEALADPVEGCLSLTYSLELR